MSGYPGALEIVMMFGLALLLFKPPRRTKVAWLAVAVLISTLLLASAAAAADVPPAEVQIAAAVLAAPAELREGATVLGYNPQGGLVRLREGKNELICLANDPSRTSFSVACYHRDLEPYMARGRELAAQKVTGQKRNDIRWKEVAEGKLSLPREPRTLYVLTGTGFDVSSGKVPAMGHLRAFCHTGIHGAIDQAERQCTVADVPRNCRCPHHDQPTEEIDGAPHQRVCVGMDDSACANQRIAIDDNATQRLSRTAALQTACPRKLAVPAGHSAVKTVKVEPAEPDTACLQGLPHLITS